MATAVFLRFSPMVAPVMTPVTVKIHHWFVPLRLLWDDFEDFITGGPDGRSVPPIPAFFIGAGTDCSPLMSCLGLPPGPYTNNFNCSSLPFRAYRLIWNEYYRDQNVQDPCRVSTTSGNEDWWSTDDYGNMLSLLPSPWEKDYFTTATPWEQKGAAVNVPVNGLQSSTSLSSTINFTGSFESSRDYMQNDMTVYDRTISGSGNTLSGPTGSITADVTTTGNLSTTIGNINLNQFREAMAMQRFEEHRAGHGSRYVEYVRYLGVKASDARLQRPEYLGGGRSVIQFSEVLQTAEDGDTPVGTMRGHGIGAMRTNHFLRFFEEHGFVMTLLSIRPKSIYMQGLPKMFSRYLKTDYWQKEFEHIGQQEIYNRELYLNGENPDGVFGYSDRYNEYRSHPSTVCGEFTDLLKYWHLARDFSAQPVLNSDFISSLPSDRIFADQTGNDTIYMMVNNFIKARRMVSRRGNPI